MSIPKYIWSDGLNDEDYIWSDGVDPVEQQSYVWSDGTLSGSYVWSDGTTNTDPVSTGIEAIIQSTQEFQSSASYSGYGPGTTISVIESFQSAQTSNIRRKIPDNESYIISTQEVQTSRARSSEDLGELGDILGVQASQTSTLEGRHYAGTQVEATQYPQMSEVQVGNISTPNYIIDSIAYQSPQNATSIASSYTWVVFTEIQASQAPQASDAWSTSLLPGVESFVASMGSSQGDQVGSLEATTSVPEYLGSILSTQIPQVANSASNGSIPTYVSQVQASQALQGSDLVSTHEVPNSSVRILSTQEVQRAQVLSEAYVPIETSVIIGSQRSQRAVIETSTRSYSTVVSTQAVQESSLETIVEVPIEILHISSSQYPQTSSMLAGGTIPEYTFTVVSTQGHQTSSVVTSWTKPEYVGNVIASQIPQASESVSDAYRVASLSSISATQVPQESVVQSTYLMPDGTSVIIGMQTPQSSLIELSVTLPEYEVSILSSQSPQRASILRELPITRYTPMSNPLSVLSINWNTFVPKVKRIESPIVEDIQVTLVPDWNTSMYISWEVPDTLGVGEPLFNIYASSSQEGPFVKITEDSILDNQYVTNWTNQDSKVYEEYFTVEISYTDGTIYRSHPATPSVNLPRFHILRYRDIIRREAILLDKFVGVDTVVYVPKTYGLRCTECYDTVHQKLMHDHCSTCYGTGFQGGYNTGMLTKISYSPRDPNIENTYYGDAEPITITAWTIPYPYIPPRAILIRTGDRKAFRVESHRGTTEMLTIPQKQSLILRELSRDAIENSLIDIDDSIPVLVRDDHVHQ